MKTSFYVPEKRLKQKCKVKEMKWLFRRVEEVWGQKNKKKAARGKTNRQSVVLHSSFDAVMIDLNESKSLLLNGLRVKKFT